MSCFDDGLVQNEELLAVKKSRSQMYLYEKVYPELEQQYEEDGWRVDRRYKQHTRMMKPKTIDEQFENEIWLLFMSLGFTLLNRDRNFRIPYDKHNPNICKQIDIFAVDEQTALVIECKASEEALKECSFKDEIEAIQGIKAGITKEIKKRFPNRKVKFILATKNYIVNEIDQKRMESLHIAYFNEETIHYYQELARHLGYCARFQLLGNLFAGEEIQNIENRIPAIQGKMGGHTYYSFLIEPEKLLKIGYVLHRNEANSNMMPTYQRLIKKSRLKGVQEFVDNGGYFPNSIVINLESSRPRFDKASANCDDTISRIGVLHLPKKYRSAYIIDGQHRLYGYAGSKFKNTNTVPVVAFVNLDRKEQIELFMDINENQKAVSKNLRHTLNADLLWEATDKNQQRQALRLVIAQRLGEDTSSPLYGRIIIGENEKTLVRCITIETVQKALSGTKFFSQFGKNNEIVENGTFDRGDNDNTFEALLPYLKLLFQHIKENLTAEWNAGEDNKGLLTINMGVFSLIRIFDDITNHLIASRNLEPKKLKAEYLVREAEYYLSPLLDFFRELPPADREQLRTNYGTGGRTKLWRTLQKAIADRRPEFRPEGMEDWWRNNAKLYNVESFSMIQDIEDSIKRDFHSKLKNYYGDNWFTSDSVPQKVYTRANGAAVTQNYKAKLSGEEVVTAWDCVTIADCKEIALYGHNWREIFEPEYTRPEEGKLRGGKGAKTEWFDKVARIQTQNTKTYSVTEEEYKFLKEIHKWLLKQ